MKKNLKKVISAVIALAVAGSLIPASFAAKLTLTDVAETAPYATAVNTLVALNVINGYEDNTFLPDNLITRAEVTKVVVAALNKSSDAESLTGPTGFVDVADDFWANGFINVGVRDKFINGMENNTFAPQANVTYAQVVKMLVSSMGYEEYAQYLGGWPKGYISIADSEGITKGVVAAENQNVTRAQVAQLVYNAMNTPIVENVGMEYTNLGTMVPKIEKQDGTLSNGTRKYYKSILTSEYDAYAVEGYVLNTPKTDSSNLEKDEVQFGIAKSEYYEIVTEDVAFDLVTGNLGASQDIADFDENATPAGSHSKKKITATVGDTDIADYMGVYGSAIIVADEYGDYSVLSFVPSGKNKSVKFDGSLIDTTDLETSGAIDSTKIASEDEIRFFSSETATKSQKYSLVNETLLKLYVNGVAVPLSVTGNDFANYITYVLQNEAGTIELVDTYKTDGDYDTIYVDYYETAQVDQITSSDNLKLKKVGGVTRSKTISLDTELNEDLVYSITLDGEAVELSALQKDDVVSIAYDVSQADMADSNFYEIHASRNVQVGKLTSIYAEDEIVTIGGENYSFVNPNFASATSALTRGNEYTIYLDAFGRIFLTDTYAANAKYAILDNVRDNGDEWRVTLFTVEGTSKQYYIDKTKGKVIDATVSPATEVTAGAQLAKLQSKVFVSGTSGTKKPVEGRVVEYKVSSSSGDITSITFLATQADTIVSSTDLRSEFRARTMAAGNVKMSDATKVINAIEYDENNYASVSDLTAETVAYFADGVEYEAYAYGDKMSDNTFPLVVVVEGESAYNAETRFAVVTAAASEDTDEAGDEIGVIPALYNGEEVDLIASDVVVGTSPANLEKGDVIFFQVDNKGYIDRIDVIFSMDANNLYDYEDMLTASIVNGNFSSAVVYPDMDLRPEAPGTQLPADFVTNWYTTAQDAIQIVYGPIVKAADNYFGIGQIDATMKTNVANAITASSTNYVYEIDLSDSTNIYLYDYSLSKNQVTLDGYISESSVTVDAANEDIIDWNLTLYDKDGNGTVASTETDVIADGVAMALAYVVDGEAVDVLVLANN